VLGAAIAVGATQLFGGGGNGNASSHALLKPSQFQVDVLNGTNPPVNGLAGVVSDKIESEGYHTGSVGNSQSSFAISVVMFKRGLRPEAAKLARKLGIRRVQLLTSDVKQDTAGAPVVVVVGQDKKNFSG
jgi:hypothetical protein